MSALRPVRIPGIELLDPRARHRAAPRPRPYRSASASRKSVSSAKWRLASRLARKRTSSDSTSARWSRRRRASSGHHDERAESRDAVRRSPGAAAPARQERGEPVHERTQLAGGEHGTTPPALAHHGQRRRQCANTSPYVHAAMIRRWEPGRPPAVLAAPTCQAQPAGCGAAPANAAATPGRRRSGSSRHAPGAGVAVHERTLTCELHGRTRHFRFIEPVAPRQRLDRGDSGRASRSPSRVDAGGSSRSVRSTTLIVSTNSRQSIAPRKRRLPMLLLIET